MSDTNVSNKLRSKENLVVNEASNTDMSESQHLEITDSLDQPPSVEVETLKLPNIEVSPDSNEVLQNTLDVAELSQEGKTTAENSEEFKVIEEEYEDQYEEDGVLKVATKKRLVKINKDDLHIAKEKLNKGVEEVETEEECEEEELNEYGELKTVTKKQLINQDNSVEVPAKQSQSFEEIEEEFDEDETDENNEIVTVHKKRTIKIPKRKSEEPQEEMPEVEEHETFIESFEENKAEETTEFVEDKLDEKEDTLEKKVKEREKQEEKEDEEGKETSYVSEKKSAESLSSTEILPDQEKIAMAQQYEVLTRLRSEHIALKKKNLFLNNKLVQYFKKQKMDHVFAETKDDPLLEQQYLKKLTIFHETNQQMTEEKLKINTEWEAQRNVNEALAEKVKQGWEELFSHKKEIAAKLIDSRTGRTIPYDKAIEDLLNRQEAQLKLISECRLAQIKLKRRIEGKQIERQMQHAGKEFNLMDYEKLSSLKEYYMDKITERDIEIQEVSQKMTAMDNTLSQVKEQLRKKEEEIAQEQDCLQRVTMELNNKRANLNMLKTARHQTEKSTAKIKQESGLLAYPVLLKDYEEKTQLLELLVSETETLKQAHRAALVRIRKMRESVKRRGMHEREVLGVSQSAVTYSNVNNMY